jgi:hypothetical protein
MLNTTLGSACELMWAYRIINQPMVLNLMSLKNDFEVWRELQVQDCHIALCNAGAINSCQIEQPLKACINHQREDLLKKLSSDLFS